LLRAPFPWFGGKRRVVDVVWRAFGPDIPNVIDPFMGSCALLARPTWWRRQDRNGQRPRSVPRELLPRRDR
jgi:hypothetical protein